MQDNKYNFVLRLADDALILGQRLSEWCGHGPVLEEDIALSNTSLDYIGQATNLFKYAAELAADGRDEDALAFLRQESEYKNLLMLELPNGDYAFTIARQYLYSSFTLLYLTELANSSDSLLKGYAEKSIKEVRYHVQHASDWVLRMGDGTEESHNRIQTAIQQIWSYSGEFFEMDEVDQKAVDEGYGVDKASLRDAWQKAVTATLTEATLQVPESGWNQSGGRSGRHTEHMGFLLAEMQYLQRAYPGARW